MFGTAKKLRPKIETNKDAEFQHRTLKTDMGKPKEIYTGDKAVQRKIQKVN